MISFSCPKCQAFLSVDDHQAGSRYACPSCGQLMRVPTPPTAVKEVITAGTNFSASPPVFSPPAGSSPSGIQVQYDAGRSFVTWPCTYCNVRLKAGLEHIGQSIQCPACRHSLPIPDPNAGYAVPGKVSGLARGAGRSDLAGAGAAAVTPRGASAGRRVGLLIGLLAATFLVVGGAVALLIWRPWAGKAAPSDELIKFLPDNSDFLAAVDIKGLVASSAYRKVEGLAIRTGGKGFNAVEEEMRREVGLGWSELDRAMIGGKLNDRGEVTVVVGTKQPVSATDLLRKSRHQAFFREEKVGAYTMYTHSQLGGPGGGLAFSVVGSTLVVLGPAGEVRKVLQRDKMPAFSPTLQAAMKQTDFSATIAAAMGKMSPEASRKLQQDLGRMPNAQQMSMGFEKSEGGTLELRVGADIDMKSITFYRDAKTAKEMKDLADSALSFVKLLAIQNPAVNDLLKPIRIQAEGKTVVATMTVDVDKVIKIIEDQARLRRRF